MARPQKMPGPGPRGGVYEKPSGRAKPLLLRLWRYLSHDKWLLALAAVLSVSANLLALVGPKLSGNAIDAIRPGAGVVDFDTVFRSAAMMIVFYLLSSVLSYGLATLMVTLSRKVVRRMRQELFDHLTRLPVRFFDNRAVGDVLSVLSYDIDTINASLSHDLVQMLASAITVIGSVVMMLSISPVLVLVFAVTIPISVLFTKYRSGRVRKLYRSRSEKLGILNGYAEEMTAGLKTIRSYHREDVFLDRFEQRNADACNANCEADAFACITGPTVNFITNLSLALISIFGGLLYMANSISLGNVSSFVLYSRKFSGPINEFSNIISELQSAMAAAERVFRLLDEPEEAPDAPDAVELKNVRGDVALQDVHFGYDPQVPVLKGLSLDAKDGQTVAIVGPTGCGKTTIINLLMRFYDADSGSITIDGHELCSVTRESLRKAFSMVLQDTWLFTGTIYENLAYGRPEVTREQVQAAARAAHVDSYIQSLPQGYDTLLADGGEGISKGQKQLLTIARAMLLDAPMLILDEATSNVDTRTERTIQAAMLELMAGRTCFVIAHRLSTIRGADKIAVINDGRVAECGTHDELMAKGGIYCELYRAQFDAADEYAAM